jgi:hypothetical protein
MLRVSEDLPEPEIAVVEGGEFAVFDIETGPLCDEALRLLCPPPKLPPHPGEFDPASVKYGNTKDAVKRAEKLADYKSAHELAVKNFDANCVKAAAECFDKFKEDAALDATTGRVVAIGLRFQAATNIIDCDGDKEEDGIHCFWAYVAYCLRENIPMIGWNSNGFDLPFLVRRSWILGIPIPFGVRQGRYWSPLFIDLMRVWGFDQPGQFAKLDVVAKALGLEGKVEEVDGVAVSGATFYQLWRENRAVAETYLLQDIALPGILAKKIGVV